ncbi:MAG: hypothetical protein D6767_10670, partial [Candidatus Hydrogenedentota bacterium]
MSRQATDFLRILSAVFIIFNHSYWEYYVQWGKKSSWIVSFSALLNQFGKPAVLFFIFLSGYAFANQVAQEEKRGKVFSTKNFFRNRFGRILPVYILASLLALFLEKKFSWSSFFTSLFDGSAMFHLYFIPLILALYVLFIFFIRLRLDRFGTQMYVFLGLLLL